MYSYEIKTSFSPEMPKAYVVWVKFCCFFGGRGGYRYSNNMIFVIYTLTLGFHILIQGLLITTLYDVIEERRGYNNAVINENRNFLIL